MGKYLVNESVVVAGDSVMVDVKGTATIWLRISKRRLYIDIYIYIYRDIWSRGW